ncbi:hypothetical protein [Bombella saccharophila]|uniref:Uncharacterized protein n=1 Tax=Bombella saccharophila TaxID=2967338 RepID=A0ABT3W7S5_9PROT|nr:hypothetical protein [Bombella saccharophila]MCX5615140.1 hypothetical protein [Bombella saccharophila]PHI96189.1 hypothetical protein BG621_04240 [Parasaccharibacter apium]
MTFRRMATFALIASALTSQAAFAAAPHGKAHPCRNEKGQFAKCEKPKAKPCRNEKGQFAKCANKKANAATADAAKDSANPMKSDMPAPNAAEPMAPAHSTAQ